MIVTLTKDYNKIEPVSKLKGLSRDVKGDFYREAILYDDMFYKSILLKSIVKRKGLFVNMVDPNQEIVETTLVSTYYFSDLSEDGICGYSSEDLSYENDLFKLSEVLTTGYVTKTDGSIKDIGLSTYVLSEGGADDRLEDGTVLESTYMGITSNDWFNCTFPSMILNPTHLTYESKLNDSPYTLRNMLLANSFVNEFSYEELIKTYTTNVYKMPPKVFGVKSEIESYATTTLKHFFIELSKLLILRDIQYCNIIFSPKKGFNITHFMTSLDNDNVEKYNHYFCLISLLLQDLYNDHIKGIYSNTLYDKYMVYELTPTYGIIRTEEYGKSIIVKESRSSLFSNVLDSYVFETINNLNINEQAKIV